LAQSIYGRALTKYAVYTACCSIYNSVLTWDNLTSGCPFFVFE
jgi:hypothetical protein